MCLSIVRVRGITQIDVSLVGTVYIYVFLMYRKWNRIEKLTTISEPVHDIAFAPNMGR